MENLESLDISGNPIGDIPEEFRKLNKLTSINIQRTNLTFEDEKRIDHLRPGISVEH